MRATLPLLTAVLLVSSPALLRADQLNMQNGDRYIGKVVSMTADTVVLQSEILGTINVPRKKVASIALGVNQVAKSPATKPSVVVSPTHVISGQADLPIGVALRTLAANTNLVTQVRDQMLSDATPEAKQKYDALVGGLTTGKLNLKDIRAQAKTSADQLRSLKKDLGPEAGDTLDMYLEVLDSFLNETAATAR